MDLHNRPPTLVLAPIDQGVRNVGGRPGANEGPKALLDALEKAHGLPSNVEVREVHVENQPGTLEADLDSLTATVRSVLDEDRTPIVLGGDHGTTYATVRGIAQVHPSIGVCYLDAHFDLRPFDPEHTSGSSFRRLIEEEIVAPERVLPIGVEPPTDDDAGSTTAKLAAYADRVGIPWVPLEQAKDSGPGRLARERMQEGAWVASLDADAITEEHAPGVSAPGPGRFSREDAQAFLDAAVEHALALDIVEFAPRLDVDQRTRRTLADLLWHVLDRASQAPR